MAFKKKKREGGVESKKKLSVEDILNGKATLNVTGDKPLSQAYLNTFFRLFTAEQIVFFEELYLEFESKLKDINMSGEAFMKYAKESYGRYQEFKKLDAFQPMDKKSQKYVEAFLRKSIQETWENR